MNLRLNTFVTRELRRACTHERISHVARIFVTRRLPGDALERLRTHADVDIWEGEMPPTPDELVERVGEAEGLLTLLTERVDGVAARRRAGCASRNYAVGSDNIDLDACAARGIVVGTTPATCSPTRRPTSPWR